MEEKGKKVKGQKGGWRIGEAWLNNHFEKIVWEKLASLRRGLRNPR
jgi:hypothetical protein